MPRPLLCLLAIPVVFADARTPRPLPDQRGASIRAVQAFLFYNDRGSFSANVIDNPGFTFWNTIIGEGSAEGPSEATLVTVSVANVPEQLPANAAVRLSARTDRGVVLDRSVSIGVPGTNRVFVAGFWLYDTGCLPITLSARLEGLGASRAVSKQIPFACGE